MDVGVWLVYLVAAIGLSVSPGPNGLLVLTHGVLYGHRRTLLTIFGGVLGFMLVIGLSLFGIGALLQTSAYMLIILKLCGGVYLIWLGFQLWRSEPLQMSSSQSAGMTNLNMFRSGFLSAVSNPKAILFFSAFLSQFVDPDRELWPQFVIMGLTFAVTEFCYEYFVARTAHQFRPWLQKHGRNFNRSCGGVFMAIGSWLPLSQ